MTSWSISKSYSFCRLRRDDFQKIAQEIVTVFPTEPTDTYYIPAQNGKRARGKLWDTYNHLRETLASVGFIERRSRKPKLDGTEETEVFGF